VKRFPAWVTYTVLRLLLIAVPLAILLIVVPFQYWVFSTIAAVIIGFCLSYLLLSKQRAAVSTELYERRARGRVATADDEVEDAVVDAAPRRRSSARVLDDDETDVLPDETGGFGAPEDEIDEAEASAGAADAASARGTEDGSEGEREAEEHAVRKPDQSGEL
jgi:hypothetical protein